MSAAGGDGTRQGRRVRLSARRGPGWLLLAIWAVACAPAPPVSGNGVLKGSVAYRESVTLPPDAVVEVKLYDVSILDGAAPVIAQATVAAAGRQSPFPFEIRYDPKKIQAARRYALRATIRSGGRLLFTTDAVRQVITHGNPTEVALRLVRIAESTDARGEGAARVEALRADLAGYRAVHGTSTAGNVSTAWTAYFDGAVLKGIDETSDQGEHGAAENEYYFEGGSLVAYVSRGARAVTDPARPAGDERVTLRLAFGGSGAATEQSKTVEGRPVPVEASEVEGARARAAFLAGEASRAAARLPAPAPAPGDPPS